MDNAAGLARQRGVSDAVIGLTMVAVGSPAAVPRCSPGSGGGALVLAGYVVYTGLWF